MSWRVSPPRRSRCADSNWPSSRSTGSVSWRSSACCTSVWATSVTAFRRQRRCPTRHNKGIRPSSDRGRHRLSSSPLRPNRVPQAVMTTPLSSSCLQAARARNRPAGEWRRQPAEPDPAASSRAAGRIPAFGATATVTPSRRVGARPDHPVRAGGSRGSRGCHRDRYRHIGRTSHTGRPSARRLSSGTDICPSGRHTALGCRSGLRCGPVLPRSLRATQRPCRAVGPGRGHGQ